MEKEIKIAIFGGSGYGGSEFLRILLFHPSAEIVLVTANEHAGKSVGEVHKNLFGLTDLRFENRPKICHRSKMLMLRFSLCRTDKR